MLTQLVACKTVVFLPGNLIDTNIDQSGQPVSSTSATVRSQIALTIRHENRAN
jgi:hypothetical protein